MSALRSLWNATLELEQLRVPVQLAASRSGGDDLRLYTLHRPCAHPLVQSRQCPVHGEVPAGELVQGWQVSPGEYVLVEDAELETALGPVSAERSIETLQVIPDADVDPVLVTATYFLMPAAGDPARRGYAVIEAALEVKDAALLVRFAYLKQKVGVVRRTPDGALLLQVLAPVEDRHPVAGIVEELATVEVSDEELRLATKLIRQKLQPIDESLLVSHRKARLRGLLASKVASGAEPVKSVPSENGRTAVVDGLDLEEALRRSLGMKPRTRRRKAAAA